MKTENQNKFSAIRNLRFAGLGFMILAFAACSTDTTTQSGAAVNATTVPAHTWEKIFPTPEQAVSAYIDATRANDKTMLLKILGPDAARLISSGDEVADRKGRARVLAAYDKAHKIEQENDNKDVLVIGEEDWPLPMPLVRVRGGWQWDTKAGAEEILNRRIGRNELNVIQICRAYVEAQRDYAEMISRDGKAPVYAQKFVSDKGKHDGLYWPAAASEEESPLGPLIAEARAEGYKHAGTHHMHQAYHGYYYKILVRQGAHAAGGAKEYIAHGRMTGGFALLAFPAKYNDSGVMSFIVNQNGIVYEKNLGADTASAAAHMTSYDPDASWHVNGPVD